MRGKGKFVGAMAVTLAALTAAACGSSSGGGSSGPKGNLEFAMFLPFSGPNAAYGPEGAAGCYPAVREIDAAGGILGHKIHCTPVDDKGEPADAVPAANRMLASSSSLVGVIGTDSNTATAVVPLFQQAHIPVFSTTGQVVVRPQHRLVLLAHPVPGCRTGQRDGRRGQEARYHPSGDHVRERHCGSGVGAYRNLGHKAHWAAPGCQPDAWGRAKLVPLRGDCDGQR